MKRDRLNSAVVLLLALVTLFALYTSWETSHLTTPPVSAEHNREVAELKKQIATLEERLTTLEERRAEPRRQKELPL